MKNLNCIIIIILIICVNTNAEEFVILSIRDYAKYAGELLPEGHRAVICEGSIDNNLFNANLNAFKKYTIAPKYLTNWTIQTIETTLLGQKVTFPGGISSLPWLSSWRANGEFEMFEGAKQFGRIVTTTSYVPSSSYENIAASHPDQLKWSQVLIFQNRSVTLDLLRRAEAAKYNAIVLTIDSQLPQLQRGIPYFYLINGPNLTHNLDKYPNQRNEKSATDATIDDIKWIRSLTTLPIVAKGMNRNI